MPKSAAHAIRAWRQRLPEDQRSLAKAAALLGVSKAQLYRYERGERQVAPERVPAIEAVTQIPRWILRPDVYRVINRKQAEQLLAPA